MEVSFLLCDEDGMRELECILSLQVVLASRDAGSDARQVDPMTKLANAIRYLVNEKGIVPAMDGNI